MKNYYRILNIKRTASDSEIRRNYLALTKQFGSNPKSGDPAYADKLSEINEAYNTLIDSKARAAYDMKLKDSDSSDPVMDDTPRTVVREQMQSGPKTVEAKFAQTAVGMTQAQLQVQLAAVRNQAFQAGHARGFTEARTADSVELNKLNSSIDALMEDIKQLKAKANDSDRARRDAEQTLLSRNRELAQEKLRANEIEIQLQALRDALDEKNVAKRTAAEVSALREALSKSQQRERQLETEVMKSRAQMQTQQEKRGQMRDQVDELNRKIRELGAELRAVRAENIQLRKQNSGEASLPDTEMKTHDIISMIREAHRIAKPTLYGALGVLVWATDDEINSAFAKLVKKYSSLFDEASIEKLAKINDAYMVLSEPYSRIEYNASIGIVQQKIEADRIALKENQALIDEYRGRIAGEDFWAEFDDAVVSALAGDAEAQNKLGEWYCNGDRLERDMHQSFFWFKEAAKLGHPDAMYNLGICYINGEGVEQNKNIGHGFIRQAAKLGSQMAAQYFQD